MKKVFWWILAIVFVACLTLSVIFIVRCAGKKNDDVVGQMTVLEDEYTVGEKVYFNFVAFTKNKLNSLTYQINNGAEIQILGVRTGESKDYTGALPDGEYGEFYINSRIVEITTNDYTPGWYNISFYGYDESGARFDLTAQPFSFKLIQAR